MTSRESSNDLKSLWVAIHPNLVLIEDFVHRSVVGILEEVEPSSLLVLVAQLFDQKQILDVASFGAENSSRGLEVLLDLLEGSSSNQLGDCSLKNFIFQGKTLKESKDTSNVRNLQFNLSIFLDTNGRPSSFLCSDCSLESSYFRRLCDAKFAISSRSRDLMLRGESNNFMSRSS